MIDYSLVLRSSNPLDANAVKKIYPNLQVRETLTLQQFAKHIADHGSCFGRDTVMGVITAAVDCLREQLLNGNAVSLGELGTFYLGHRARGAESSADFNPAQDFTALTVRWNRGQNFGDLLQDAEWNYVSTRDEQAKAKKAEKAAMDTALGVTSGTGTGTGTGGSTNATGTGTVEE